MRNIAIRLITDDIGYGDVENAVTTEEEDEAYFEHLRQYFSDATDDDIELGFNLMLRRQKRREEGSTDEARASGEKCNHPVEPRERR